MHFSWSMGSRPVGSDGVSPPEMDGGGGVSDVPPLFPHPALTRRAKYVAAASRGIPLLEQLPEQTADFALTTRAGPRDARRARHSSLGGSDAELSAPTPAA